MATTRDVAKGVTIKIDGEFYTIVDFAHLKVGRGGAFMKIHIKNLKTGAVIDRTFNNGATIDVVRVEEKSMQYIYREGETYYFMDQETYEQIPLAVNILREGKKYLKESDIVHLLTVEGEILGIKLPNFCDLKVVETEPPLKGAKAAGGLKPAILETGISIQVPLFITPGEIVRVDTRTDRYVERVK
ncbi:MAG: elongation factor P [Candidatus Stahlbacteria bacterium]|nr:elongation factor P [Candidatus Stahlbacteria bacterium]